LNKSEFISLIEHPETLGKSHVTALKHIAADFPYFQCAQTLLTKALYNEHHYEFEKHLKHTSLMVPDRAVLFRYIHNLKEVAEVYPPPQPAEQYTHPTALPEPVLEILEDIIPVPVEIETKPQEEPIAEPEPVEEKIEAAVEIEETAEPPVVEEIIVPEPEIAVLIEEEEPEARPEVIVDEVKEEPVVEAEPIIEEPAVEIKVNVNEIHSFSEWLKLQQEHKIVVDPSQPEPETIPEPEIIAEKEEIVPKVTAPEPPQVEAQEELNDVPQSNVNDFESILDKFIRENPRISRPKAEFYNPVNMAKQSIESDDEMVTETLANVYYKQGHYKKAIRAYEKLCLIYPHKMTYFASLIQKIKTENKD
jgi:tetratricopeptide (TPR) repeat protein